MRILLERAAWPILAFLCGCIPFRLWTRRLFGTDDPLATDAHVSGSAAPAALAFALDYAKGAVPVALALAAGAPWRVAVAVAPIAGDVLSPWLRFRGGKGVATSAGVWAALLWPLGAVVPPAILLAWSALLVLDAWPVLLTALGWLGAMVVLRVDGWLVAVWGVHAFVLAWAHRRDLAAGPRLRR